MLVDVVEQRQDGNAADARRRERAFAVRAHVAVDHAAVVMRADGDAAVDMGHDEIAVFIASAELVRMEFRDGLLVEHVGMGVAIDAFDARQTCVITVFIDVCRIQRIGVSAEFLREFPRQHDAELRGMLAAADGRHRVVVKPFVNGRHAAWLRIGAAAAADEYVDVRRRDAVVFQHVHDDIVAERHLVVHVGELQQDWRVMENAFFEERFFVFVKAYLRGGRARVDDKDL